MRKVTADLLVLLAGIGQAGVPEGYRLSKTIPIPGDGGLGRPEPEELVAPSL
jgi:hypothetical protein